MFIFNKTVTDLRQFIVRNEIYEIFPTTSMSVRQFLVRQFIQRQARLCEKNFNDKHNCATSTIVQQFIRRQTFRQHVCATRVFVRQIFFFFYGPSFSSP